MSESFNLWDANQFTFSFDIRIFNAIQNSLLELIELQPFIRAYVSWRWWFLRIDFLLCTAQVLSFFFFLVFALVFIIGLFIFLGDLPFTDFIEHPVAQFKSDISKVVLLLRTLYNFGFKQSEPQYIFQIILFAVSYIVDSDLQRSQLNDF